MRNRAHAPLFFFLFVLGCMDPVHDFGECKKIEIARCQLRKDCQRLKDTDFDKRFPGFDYNTCVTYAKEHCKTREIGQPDSMWDADDVAVCVEAISALYPGACDELERGRDETDAENGLITYPAMADAGEVVDAGPGGPCWFINRPPESEEDEDKDDSADSDSDNSEDKD